MIRRLLATERIGAGTQNGKLEPESGFHPQHRDGILWALRSSMLVRVPVFAAFHAFLFVIAYRIAFELRFDFAIPQDQMARLIASLPAIVICKTTVFWMFRCFHNSWRYVTFADLTMLLKASLVSLLLIAGLDHFLLAYQIPRTVVILDTLLGVILVGTCRAFWRLFSEGLWKSIQSRHLDSGLLVGADHQAGLLAQQINAHQELGFRVRGFLSVDGTGLHRRFAQVPVLGFLKDLRKVASKVNARYILVRANGIPGAVLRMLMDECEALGLELKILPNPEEQFGGNRSIPVREIRIEDLLRRDPVSLDNELIHKAIQGKRVLVTGAGGSIGSEICRQLLRFEPLQLILVDQAENNVFTIDRNLTSLNQKTTIIPCVGDVTDSARMRQIFSEHRPAIVFHAAAHKHVPLMEINVGESLKNNVLGTRCVADLADSFGVGIFVLISTDKAVNPTSMMGVTKHLAERYVHSKASDSSTAFIVVRFGNVLASVGSVVPIFQEQIRNGGPITVTDPRMRRFFMTIPEASQLVLQAAVMGSGGEIFVLDMGDPVRIVDLAKDLIKLSGLSSDAIEIEFTGVRPGEKLYEELYFSDENTLPTQHSKLRAAYHRVFTKEDVDEMIRRVESLIEKSDDDIREQIREMVPEYRNADFADSESMKNPQLMP